MGVKEYGRVKNLKLGQSLNRRAKTSRVKMNKDMGTNSYRT